MGRNMDKNNERKCLACGKIHDGKSCPLILNKLEKYEIFSKKNYLMGNIVLECIHKNIDFFQILLEIAESNEETCEALKIWNPVNMPIDASIEYFAVSLNCSSRDFFMSPEKTALEYSKLIHLEYLSDVSLIYDDRNIVKSIEMLVEIDNYKDLNTIRNFGLSGRAGYTFLLCKELSDDDIWSYALYLELPVLVLVEALYQSEKVKHRTYSWESLNYADIKSILLVSEKEGKLKDFFERELDDIWTEDELVTECAYEDSRFDLWMNKLENATANNLLEWDKSGKTSYRTRYEHTDIKIEICENSKYGDGTFLYVRNQSGRLGLRFGHQDRIYLEIGEGAEITERIESQDKKEEKTEAECVDNSVLRIISLAEQIEKQYIYRKGNDICLRLPKREIKHTDVIAVTQSMICHNQQHMVTPMCGIVQLLTIDNLQISYEIYVGYCRECGRYYVFKSDFIEMRKVGTPLCAVYHDESNSKKTQYASFKYKSQSILNAMGYNVGADDNLSASERQLILLKALQSNLFEIHDLLSFLNWLVQTRKPQAKYHEAVRKWTDDIEFVENYEKNSREVVKIDSITLK